MKHLYVRDVNVVGDATYRIDPQAERDRDLGEAVREAVKGMNLLVEAICIGRGVYVGTDVAVLLLAIHAILRRDRKEQQR